MEMDWISVKDRLPSRAGLMDDENDYVLVFEQYKHIPGGDVSICAYTKDGWSDHDNFGNVRTDHITHWMPLPDPPDTDPVHATWELVESQCTPIDTDQTIVFGRDRQCL